MTEKLLWQRNERRTHSRNWAIKTLPSRKIPKLFTLKNRSKWQLNLNLPQAGGIAHYGFAGMFWKAVPEKDWPQDEEYLSSIKNCAKVLANTLILEEKMLNAEDEA